MASNRQGLIMGKRTTLTTKQQLFVEALPKHNFNIIAAGLAAGYTHQYSWKKLPVVCKTSKNLSKAIAKKKAEIQTNIKPGYSLERLTDELWGCYRRSAKVGNETAAKGALDSLIRMQGGFIDRTHNINENIEYKPPAEPEERLKWLKAEVKLLERQLSAGTAIAGELQRVSDAV